MPILSQITFLFYSGSLDYVWVVIVLGSRRSDEFLIIPLGFWMSALSPFPIYNKNPIQREIRSSALDASWPLPLHRWQLCRSATLLFIIASVIAEPMLELYKGSFQI